MRPLTVKVIVKVTLLLLLYDYTHPSIAQLVERWTVVVVHQKSIGRWFKSGSKEFLLSDQNIYRHCQRRVNDYVYTFLDSLVVRISACHVEGPGSIPGRGEFFYLLV